MGGLWGWFVAVNLVFRLFNFQGSTIVIGCGGKSFLLLFCSATVLQLVGD